MATTKYSVDLPNGKSATFHQGHLKSGVWHGFVYVAKHRVYGTVAINSTTFTPTGNHADLVAAATVEVVDENVSLGDALAQLGTSEAPEDERFQLASHVN